MGGNDFIAGNDGQDSIVGGSGNDTIYGDGGNDWMEGGTGNDLISGGSGQDSYVFREFGAANADTISTFSSDWDKIRSEERRVGKEGGTGRLRCDDVHNNAAAGATAAKDAY